MERQVLATRPRKPTVDVSTQALDGQVAMAMAIARRLRPPMKVFANEVRLEMGLNSLSRRAIYAWERGEARVPAAALLAAAKVSQRSVDELLARARYLDSLGLRPGE
jgi:transcriptional regulator with XRE-family HTH domain